MRYKRQQINAFSDLQAAPVENMLIKDRHTSSGRTFKAKFKNGFSLIELLIVITIMGLLASIVMPETFNMLEQHEAQVEQRKLVDFFREHKHQAYLHQEPITIEFAGTHLQSSTGNSISFEHITTDFQRVNITELGSFEQELVYFQLRGKYVEKELFGL